MNEHDDRWRAARDEAERLGAAYEVPVERVRARVRRRRGTRAAAAGAAAVAAVGAVVVGVPQVLGAAGGSSVGSSADWPAQFVWCGQRVEDVAAAPGRVTQTLVASQDAIGTDRTWLATTSTHVEGAASVAAPGTDVEVVLVRDGVVVGVADASGTVEVGSGEPGAPPAVPGTSVQGYATHLVSCDTYPDGEGDPEVPAGEYDVVMTQTVTWTDPDGAAGTGRATVTAPVRVTDEPGDVRTSPEECGARTSDLARTAGPEANPFAVTLTADVPTTAAAGSDLGFAVTATNEGTAAVEGWTGHPGVLLTRDGRVVGVPAAHDDIGLDASLLPGQQATYDAVTDLVDCTTLGVGEHAGTSGGAPLPPGDYEVWVTTDLFLTSPAGTDGPTGDRTDVHLVYGPWPVRIG